MLSCAPLPKKTPHQPTLKKKTKKRTNQKTKTKDVILKELLKKRFFCINLSVHLIYMYFKKVCLNSLVLVCMGSIGIFFFCTITFMLDHNVIPYNGYFLPAANFY